MTLRRLTLGAALCTLVFQPVFGAVSPGAPAAPLATPDDVAELLRPRYLNGVVAIAEGKVITVKDVAQELTPQQVNGYRANANRVRRTSDIAFTGSLPTTSRTWLCISVPWARRNSFCNTRACIGRSGAPTAVALGGIALVVYLLK